MTTYNQLPATAAGAPRPKAHPALWVPTLYTAEGLPFIATLVASVQMYKSLGLSDTEIAAMVSLVAWPWSLKPLWSGFMESFKTKKHFVVATQILGGGCFGLLALSLSADSFVGWSLALFAIIAFNSATHDIAADGTYIEALSPEQQAKYVGWQGAFWNLGKILGQGVFVALAGWMEGMLGPRTAWASVMALIGVVLVLFGVYHSRVLPAGRPATHAKNAKQVLHEFWYVVTTFFQKRHVFWGLGFVLLYRLAEGQAQRILPLFLRAERTKGGLALSTADVGVAYGVFGAAAFVVGSIVAGYFTARLNLRRALLPLCAVFNVPYVVYVYLAYAQPASFWVITGAIVVEWFGYGFGFVAVTLFMMQQMATGKYKMSHYAIATSAMNLGLILPGAWSGWLSDHIGYRNFFLWVMVSTVFSFVAAWLVPFKTDEEIAAENRGADEPAGALPDAEPAQA
jgi:PAT family beta-lactamase induction signal transducer AmpG